MKNKLNKKHLTPALSPSDAEREKLPQPEAMRVAYGLVRPDPNQPRKTFSEASLAELAASIKEQGIIQPLILEFVPAAYELREPELHTKEWQVVNKLTGGVVEHGGEKLCRDWLDRCHQITGAGQDGYRIVAGERRWRAAGIAGLAELPAVVHRGLTDKQRFAIQFIENNQREAVTAIEEAEAMATQLASRRKDKPDFSPEDLAAELGISRAGCYERLKLTRLHAPVRAALLAGKISTSVAGEVAKLPTPQSQERLLKTITDEESYHFPYSVRDVQELIDDEYCKQLSDAPFKTDKVYRDNHDIAIGGDTCTVCPLRTGNMVAEFPDLKAKPNVCTNPVCFGEKCKAFHQEKAEHLKAKGAVVFTEKEFKAVKADYVSADRPSQYSIFTNEYDSPEKILGKHTPEAVMVSTADGLKPFIKRADIADAAKKAKVTLVAEKKPETAEQKAAREKKELELRESKVRRDAFVISQAKPLLKLLDKLNVKTSWEVASVLLAAGEGNYDHAFEKQMQGQKEPRLAVLATLFGRSFPLDYSGNWQDEIADAWILAGIDLVAEFEVFDKAAQKSLPLAKAGPKQGKLLEVKSSRKGAKSAKKERELFDRCYAGTHDAADQLSDLADTLGELQIAPEKLKRLRDTLREAYCAVQELKTRSKNLNKESRKAGA